MVIVMTYLHHQDPLFIPKINYILLFFSNFKIKIIKLYRVNNELQRDNIIIIIDNYICGFNVSLFYKCL